MISWLELSEFHYIFLKCLKLGHLNRPASKGLLLKVSKVYSDVIKSSYLRTSPWSANVTRSPWSPVSTWSVDSLEIVIFCYYWIINIITTLNLPCRSLSWSSCWSPIIKFNVIVSRFVAQFRLHVQIDFVRLVLYSWSLFSRLKTKGDEIK